ncbi:hypothetical protein AB205_0159480 [Aquarana catesbeiana]|uniref:Uncharacterized protein n=1 Tax=Aquarana catesbeiana TaxID=8400 RepID=A0A2G9PPD9_AQUCT|nr:hypothetical protein AB205_0159480 [Aquarana catesbeiana]
MRETPPAPAVLSSVFPAPCLSTQWGEHMAETQQVHADSSSNDISRSHECPALRPQICPM